MPTNIEFESLSMEVQVEIASILFESIPALADHWSWEYVLQELTGLPDPIVLPVRTVQLSSLTRKGSTNAVAVATYKKKLAISLPPPLLVKENELMDGFHRVAAAMESQITELRAVDIQPLFSMNWPIWLNGDQDASIPLKSNQATLS